MSSASQPSSSPGRAVDAISPHSHLPGTKRTAAQARLDPVDGVRQARSVKRRAPQACQNCRARKVRCNVAKQGVPCTHCTLDEIQCVVVESRRKRKATNFAQINVAEAQRREPFSQAAPRATVIADEHHAHPVSLSSEAAAYSTAVLPAYIKPLPQGFGEDDIAYLQSKGALSIPELELRNELIRSYAEYMHPFMPLLDWHRFVQIVDQNHAGQTVSLLLFQAVMFSGIATVEEQYLKAAGYSSRRQARRAFFNKTRLLYDLDYEDDPIVLIQSLLLMTYWRENPDGRKETHHWIELAVSHARKAGLNRISEVHSGAEPSRQKVLKRIWWSAYMRDAQIALGTRASTQIKDIEFNVPMLELTDFELYAHPEIPSWIPSECEAVRDSEKQRQLALMCIEMAKLCMCISHSLSVQYGVTGSKGSACTAAMLFGSLDQPVIDSVQSMADLLRDWKLGLPVVAKYTIATPHEVHPGTRCIVLNRAYLHMLFYAALSSIHRYRLLHTARRLSNPKLALETLNASRKAVRHSAMQITDIATTLHNLDLVPYLPSSSITVLLPAIVIHLQDVLAPAEHLKRQSLQNFCKCMQIMGQLRNTYAAADYSTAFLQTAIQRTEVGPVNPQSDESRDISALISTAQGFAQAHQPPTSIHARPDVDDVLRVQPLPRESLETPNDDAGPTARTPQPHVLTVPQLANSSASPIASWSDDLHRNSDMLPYPHNPYLMQAASLNRSAPVDLRASNDVEMNAYMHDLAPEFNGTTNMAPMGSGIDVGADVFDFPPLANEPFSMETDWLMGIGAEGLMLVGDDTEPTGF